MTSFLASNNNLAFYIDPSGQIGVGTSNMISLFNVEGSVNITSNINISGIINAQNGIINQSGVYYASCNNTAALPSFTWQQESNIGMFHASNSTIGFSTSSLERLRIDNIGNIGIATSNPTEKLQISGNTKIDCNLYVLKSLGIGLSNQTNALSVAGNALFLSNLYVLNSLGIGLSNPIYTLDINGSINAQGFCNLLLDSVNSLSTSNAPTNNALSLVNTISRFASNINISNSNILFPQAAFSSNTVVSLSNNFYLFTFSNVFLQSNLFVQGNTQINGTTTISNSINVLSNLNLFSSNSSLYFSSNMVSYVNPGTITGQTGYSFRIRNLDAINTDTRFSLGNTAATSNYRSRFALYSLGVLEQTNNYERLEIQANSNGGFIVWSNSGNGSNRSLYIYNSNIIAPNGNWTSANINIANNLSNNLLTLNCKSSTQFPAQITFCNTSNTGDLKISSDGGDFALQSGGSRITQIAGYHAIALYGGRATGTPLAWSNGTGSNFNTVIQNTQNSIGLSIVASLNQTQDLLQFKNNTGTVLSRIDSNGNFIGDVITTTAGNFLNKQVFTQGTTSYTPTVGTTKIILEMLAGGGGGGGVNNTNGTFAAGGGAGCYGQAIVSNLTNIPYTLSVGAGGNGGVAAGRGSTGGSVTITINGIVWSLSGGVGGAAGTVATNTASVGGAGGSNISGVWKVIVPGDPGFFGMPYNTLSGRGAKSLWGGGGLERASTFVGNGNPGTGFGSGGGGAGGGNNNTGGAGAPGVIVIQEFS